MYIMLTNIMDEKRIDLAYPIWGKEVAVVSMFSENVQYWIKDHLKVMLLTGKEKWLLERVAMDRELSEFVERMVIMLLDAHDHVVKTDKLADITEMVLSLEELINTVNLKDGRLNNVLLRLHLTGSEVFMCLEPVTF